MNGQHFLENPQTNWKYTAIVVILGFLVGGGILGYQYWWLPKQETEIPEIEIPERIVEDETANWKVYRNEKYRVELKYPQELEVQESEFDINGKLLNFNLYSAGERIFHLGTSDLGMEGHMRLYTIEGSEKELLVGGVKGSQFKIENMKGGPPIQQTLLKKYERLYVFVGEGDIFNKILSTFRFLE